MSLTFFRSAARFVEIADLSSPSFICDHGVPRLHLSVFAGHPTDSAAPLPFTDTTTGPFDSTSGDLSIPFRGPLHMATTHYRNPNFGYAHTWTPPRLPLPPSSTSPTPAHWSHMQNPGYPTQPLFPPMPPTTPSPPPPPLQGSTTPQRFTATSPKSHSSTPPPSMSQIQKRLPSPPVRDSRTRRGFP